MQNKTRNLFFCSWKESEKIIKEAPAVIIPIGSIEEHGPHLPLGTDSLITEYVVSELCEKYQLYFYPPITFGQVWSARNYPGTISIRSEYLKNYLKDVLLSLHIHGVNKVICYSFHNGNIQVIRDCMRKISDMYDIKNVYHIHAGNLVNLCEKYLDSKPWNGKIWHAGELETSLLLYLQADLVDMSLAPCNFPITPDAYEFQAVPWITFNAEGSFGNSKIATKQKGEKIFSVLITCLGQQIEKILAL